QIVTEKTLNIVTTANKVESLILPKISTSTTNCGGDINYTLTHSTCDLPNSGSISLTVPSEDYSISQLDLYLNGEFFKSYFNIGYASVSIDNLFPGKYTCIIHYDKTFECIFKFKFEIGYYTDWSI